MDANRKRLTDKKANDRRVQHELRQALERESQAWYFANVAFAERYWLSNQANRAEDVLNLCHESLRKWEWYYLKRLCNSELLRILAGVPVTALSLDSGGNTLAIGLNDGRVLLSNCSTGAVLREVVASDVSILSIAFSPDDACLAIGSGGGPWTSRNGQLTVFALPSGRSTELLQSEAGVPAVCFSPDGRYLAAADRFRISLFDVDTFSLELQVQPSRFHGLAFHPDGKRLAAVARSPNWMSDGDVGLVEIWNIRPAAQTVSFKGANLAHIHFTADGSTLLAASGEHVVGYEPDTGEPTFRFRAHSGQITAVAVSRDGRAIATAGEDCVVKLWDLSELDLAPKIYLGHAAAVSVLTFSSDCERLVSASADHTVRVWDATTEQRSITYTFGLDATRFRLPDGSESSSLSFSVDAVLSQDGMQYASAKHSVVIRDTLTGRRRLHLDREIRHGSVITFSPSNEWLAIYGNSSRNDPGAGLVDLIDTGSGNVVWSFHAHNQPIRQVAFSPSLDLLATCGREGGADDPENREYEPIKVWSMRSQKQSLKIDCGPMRFDAIAFSPDGEQLAGANSECVVLWNARTGVEETRGPGLGERINCIAFSLCGRYVAVGGDASTPAIGVWDRKVGGVTVLKGHFGPVQSLVFGKGLRLASGSSDKTVRVWAVVEGREVLALHGHSACVVSLAFRSNDEALLSASTDGTLKVWQVSHSSNHEFADRSLALRRRSPEWHLDRAQDAVDQEQRAPAKIHLDATRSSALPERLFLERRAGLFTDLAQWDDAAQDLEQLVVLGNAAPRAWHQRALLAARRKRSSLTS